MGDWYLLSAEFIMYNIYNLYLIFGA